MAAGLALAARASSMSTPSMLRGAATLTPGTAADTEQSVRHEASTWAVRIPVLYACSVSAVCCFAQEMCWVAIDCSPQYWAMWMQRNLPSKAVASMIGSHLPGAQPSETSTSQVCIPVYAAQPVLTCKCAVSRSTSKRAHNLHSCCSGVSCAAASPL